MTDTSTAAANILRAIRREEERAAVQRRDSSARRAELIERLVRTLGGPAAASAAMGVSRQAVEKALRADDGPWPAEPPLNWLEMNFSSRNATWGDDVPTVKQWEEIEDPEVRRQAAVRAHRKWELRALVPNVVESILGPVAATCQEITEQPDGELETPAQVAKAWEEMADICPDVHASLQPHTRQDVTDLGQLFTYLYRGVSSSDAMDRYVDEWRERAYGDTDG